MKLVPFWYIPCQWIVVDWFPKRLVTLAMILSPFVTLITGRGHWLLMTMTGRSCMPSGFAVVQVIFQSKLTSFALAADGPASRIASDEIARDRSIATVATVHVHLPCALVSETSDGIMNWNNRWQTRVLWRLLLETFAEEEIGLKLIRLTD